MALFAVLGAAAFAVFVVLPDWVAARQAATPAGAPPGQTGERPATTAAAGGTDPRGPQLEEAQLEEAQLEEIGPHEAGPSEPAVTEPEPTRVRKRDRSPPPAPRTAEPPRPAGDEAFRQAMSDGLAALDRDDYAAAREAFSRAAGLEPGSPQSTDGLARAEVGLRLAAIKGLFAEAEALEAAEDWRGAADRYGRALGLDPTVELAQRGLERSRRRAELADRLDFHLANPHRLSSDEVLREAAAVLAEAAAIEPAGPRLERQVAALEDRVGAYSTLVRAVLESDGLTEVTVYRVGRLGAFDRRTLDLRPGTYTVVGSRRGYRDVRRQLVIEPGAEPAPLRIRCEEAI